MVIKRDKVPPGKFVSGLAAFQTSIKLLISQSALPSLQWNVWLPWQLPFPKARTNVWLWSASWMLYRGDLPDTTREGEGRS